MAGRQEKQDNGNSSEILHNDLERLRQQHEVMVKMIVEQDKLAKQASHLLLSRSRKLVGRNSGEESGPTSLQMEDEEKSGVLSNFIDEQTKHWNQIATVLNYQIISYRQEAEEAQRQHRQCAAELDSLRRQKEQIYTQLVTEKQLLKDSNAKREKVEKELKQLTQAREQSDLLQQQLIEARRNLNVMVNEKDQLQDKLNDRERELVQKCEKIDKLKEENTRYEKQLKMNYELDKQKNYSTIGVSKRRIEPQLHVDKMNRRQRESSLTVPTSEVGAAKDEIGEQENASAVNEVELRSIQPTLTMDASIKRIDDDDPTTEIRLQTAGELQSDGQSQQPKLMVDNSTVECGALPVEQLTDDNLSQCVARADEEPTQVPCVSTTESEHQDEDLSTEEVNLSPKDMNCIMRSVNRTSQIHHQLELGSSEVSTPNPGHVPEADSSNRIERETTGNTDIELSTNTTDPSNLDKLQGQPESGIGTPIPANRSKVQPARPIHGHHNLEEKPKNPESKAEDPELRDLKGRKRVLREATSWYKTPDKEPWEFALNTSHKKLMQLNWNKLLEDVDVAGTILLDHLYQYGVLSLTQLQEFKSSKRTFTEQKSDLLSFLSKQNEEHFRSFLKALCKTNQLSVVEELKASAARTMNRSLSSEDLAPPSSASITYYTLQPGKTKGKPSDE